MKTLIILALAICTSNSVKGGKILTTVLNTIAPKVVTAVNEGAGRFANAFAVNAVPHYGNRDNAMEDAHLDGLNMYERQELHRLGQNERTDAARQNQQPITQNVPVTGQNQPQVETRNQPANNRLNTFMQTNDQQVPFYYPLTINQPTNIPIQNRNSFVYQKNNGGTNDYHEQMREFMGNMPLRNAESNLTKEAETREVMAALTGNFQVKNIDKIGLAIEGAKKHGEDIIAKITPEKKELVTQRKFEMVYENPNRQRNLANRQQQREDLRKVRKEPSNLAQINLEGRLPSVINENEQKGLNTIKKEKKDLQAIPREQKGLNLIHNEQKNLKVVSDEQTSLVNIRNDPNDLASIRNEPNDLVNIRNDPKDLVNVSNEQKGLLNIQNDQTNLINISNEQKSLVNIKNEQKGLVNIPNKQKGLVNIYNQQTSLINIPNEQTSLIKIPNEQKGLVNIPNEQTSIRNIEIEQKGLTNIQNQQKGLANIQNEQKGMSVIHETSNSLLQNDQITSALQKSIQENSDIVAQTKAPTDIAKVGKEFKQVEQSAYYKNKGSIARKTKEQKDIQNFENVAGQLTQADDKNTSIQNGARKFSLIESHPYYKNRKSWIGKQNEQKGVQTFQKKQSGVASEDNVNTDIQATARIFKPVSESAYKNSRSIINNDIKGSYNINNLEKEQNRGIQAQGHKFKPIQEPFYNTQESLASGEFVSQGIKALEKGQEKLSNQFNDQKNSQKKVYNFSPVIEGDSRKSQKPTINNQNKFKTIQQHQTKPSDINGTKEKITPTQIFPSQKISMADQIQGLTYPYFNINQKYNQQLENSNLGSGLNFAIPTSNFDFSRNGVNQKNSIVDNHLKEILGEDQYSQPTRINIDNMSMNTNDGNTGLIDTNYNGSQIANQGLPNSYSMANILKRNRNAMITNGMFTPSNLALMRSSLLNPQLDIKGNKLDSRANLNQLDRNQEAIYTDLMGRDNTALINIDNKGSNLPMTIQKMTTDLTVQNHGETLPMVRGQNTYLNNYSNVLRGPITNSLYKNHFASVLPNQEPSQTNVNNGQSSKDFLANMFLQQKYPMLFNKFSNKRNTQVDTNIKTNSLVEGVSADMVSTKRASKISYPLDYLSSHMRAAQKDTRRSTQPSLKRPFLDLNSKSGLAYSIADANTFFDKIFDAPANPSDKGELFYDKKSSNLDVKDIANIVINAEIPVSVAENIYTVEQTGLELQGDAKGNYEQSHNPIKDKFFMNYLAAMSLHKVSKQNIYVPVGNLINNVQEQNPRLIKMLAFKQKMEPELEDMNRETLMDLPYYNLVLDIQMECIEEFELDVCSMLSFELLEVYKKFSRLDKKNYTLVKAAVRDVLIQNYANVFELLVKENKEDFEKFTGNAEHMYNRLEFLLYSYVRA